MKTRARRILVGFTVLFITAIACGAPVSSSPDVQREPPVQPAPTEPVDSPTAESPAISTEALPSLEAPAVSTEALPSLEATVVPSSTVPLATFLETTICRAGPGEVYEVIATIEVGSEYLVVGRNSPENDFIILVAGNRQCWIGAQSVRQDGDFAGLPEIPPPVGSISGIVVNNSGFDGISGAPLRLEPSGMETQTDAEGMYDFVNVPIGDVTIHVEIPNQQPASLKITLHDGQEYTSANIGLFVVIPQGGRPTCPPWRNCNVMPIEPGVNTLP